MRLTSNVGVSLLLSAEEVVQVVASTSWIEVVSSLQIQILHLMTDVVHLLRVRIPRGVSPGAVHITILLLLICSVVVLFLHLMAGTSDEILRVGHERIHVVL